MTFQWCAGHRLRTYKHPASRSGKFTTSNHRVRFHNSRQLPQPLLRELDVPAWQEVAVMRLRWRAMLKSTKIRTVR